VTRGRRSTPAPTELRQTAVSRLDSEPPESSVLGRDALLHELQVHQVELEMQNDELRKAQLELQESRDRYYELYDLAPVGYLTLDPTGKVLEANLTATMLLGVDRDQLLGNRLSRFMTSADGDIFHHYRKRVFSSPRRQACDLKIDSSDGRSFPAHLEAISVSDPEGHRTHCRCVLVDVTELRRTQFELRETKRKFLEVAERIDAVLYIHRGSGSISYASPAYEKVWGRSVDELYESGDAWLNSIHPDDRDRVRSAYEAMLQGAPFAEEYRILRPGGEIRWIRDRASAIADDEGDTGRIVGVAHDFTEEREREAELRHAQKMEVVGTLASGIAHDFNNVLQAILGSAHQALAETSSVEESREYMRRIKAVAKRGGALANRLLTFSREHVPQSEPIHIDTVLESSASLLRRLVGNHIEVKIERAAPESVVMADPVELEQILMNLVANARDAMPEGGTLTLRTEDACLDEWEAKRHHPLAKPGVYVRLCVNDTGVGMDESTKARIFEPFFTTKEVGQGTGLGLSTVFAMVKRMGGHIDVQTEPLGGTSIAICFARLDHEVRTTQAFQPRVELSGTALLVEDDPFVRVTARKYLEELGLEVVDAGDPDEALKVCDSLGKPLDIVVTDVMMPGMTGPRLVARLMAEHPDLRPLYVSGLPRLELIEKRILEPRAPFLQKPFDIEDLGLKLEAILREKPSLRPTEGRTILLVEDNKAALMALHDYLDCLGYRVRAFSKPVEALAAAAEEQDIALLLSDLKMPKMEGDELALRLRESRPGLPVIFMSGTVDPDIMTDAAYAKKPIDLEDLAKMISSALA
jgi:two-component system cell cycle sensor histidine kinase/response regulator CckA